MPDVIVLMTLFILTLLCFFRGRKRIRKSPELQLRLGALALQFVLVLEVHLLYGDAWMHIPDLLGYSVLMLLSMPRSYQPQRQMRAGLIAVFAVSCIGAALPSLMKGDGRMLHPIAPVLVTACLITGSASSLSGWGRWVDDYVHAAGARTVMEAGVRETDALLLVLLCFVCSLLDGPWWPMLPGGLIACLLVLLYLRCGSDSFLYPFNSTRFQTKYFVPAKSNLYAKDIGDAEYFRSVYKKCCRYMEAKKPFLVDSFSLSDLSAGIFTNKSYVSKAINLSTELNFRRFVNRYRVQYAQDLFRQNMSLRVVDMAQLSGCRSVQTFCAVFKIFTGENPKTWCDRLRKSRQ